MFKEKFKYYKKKHPSPDLSKVIDFGSQSQCSLITKLTCFVTEKDDIYMKLGLIDPVKWEIYEVNSHPGLIVINNPFTYVGQRYWIARCLMDYTKKPNLLNLDPHNILRSSEDWWVSANCDNDRAPLLIEKLRWATLGYHHNWDTKEYSDDSRSQFPDDLAKLSSYIINVVLGKDDFLAQAAIVNFYHMDSNLSGHTDHSEPNSHAPLISVSFGQTAIFLVGGETLEDDPIAMYLYSGDIVIMSGRSRLNYHGVPRIVYNCTDPWNNPRCDYTGPSNKKFCSDNNCTTIDICTSKTELNGNGKIKTSVDPISRNVSQAPDRCKQDTTVDGMENRKQNTVVTLNRCKQDKFWKLFNNYISFSRININVRQVLFSGQNNLKE